ncbi:MAG: hypothetical protein ACE5KT_07290 [Methanosarcinales archaeon]
MSRELNDYDLEILKKLAPEIEERNSYPSGHQFRSILPPVSHHFAQSEEDFKNRINRLSKEELEYIIDLVFDGKERIRSIMEEDLDVFIEVVRDKISEKKVQDLKDFLGI